MCKKEKDKTPFLHMEFTGNTRPYPDFNMDDMYERVISEMTLQQTKRDQLITIYLAAFAFIVPALLDPQKNISPIVSSLVFLALGFIGYLFSLIIVRYRKYKESYWICCRTLSVMMTMEQQEWTKENIQSIFYNCLYKKVSNLMKNEKLQKMKFVRKNLFSGETLYLVINAFISSSFTGIGAGMLANSLWPVLAHINIIIGVVAWLLLFGITLWNYFDTLIKVYMVCEDHSNESFNATFGDSWFLHFYISNKQESNKSA